MLARRRWIALLAPLAAVAAWLAFGAAENGRRDDHAVPGSPSGAQRDVGLTAPPALEGGEPEERAPVAGAPVEEADALELAFVDRDGAPVAAVHWAVFRGEAVLAREETSADGLGRLESIPRDGGLELAALHVAYPPLRTTLAAEAGRRRIVLGEGAAIAGIVRVDGAPPEDPLVLRLYGDEPFLAPGDLPDAVAAALLPRGKPLASIAAETDADGAFRFAGLPVGWRGRLSWSGYALASAPVGDAVRSLEVTAPLEHLVLELASPPAIVGVVVDPGTGAPVPRPRIRATYRQGESVAMQQGSVEQDGSFRLTFPSGLPERVRLEVADTTGGGARGHVVDVPAGVRVHDAGRLAIALVREVAFGVADVEGVPVADAQVQGVAAGEEPAELRWDAVRSDADGEGKLTVASGAVALVADALGYERGRAHLPAAPNAFVEIELPRATTLELVLPADMRHLAVELWAAEEPFLALGAPSWAPRLVPRHVGGMVRSGPGGFVRYDGADDGRYAFAGLRPGVRVMVAAVDASGSRVGVRQAGPLARGEHRVVELVVERELRALEGRVVTPAGEPVAGARVSLGPAGGEIQEGERVDADGRFRFAGIAADEVLLVVTAGGFPVRRVARQPVADEPIEVVLEPGREVRVLVVDAAGAPVPDARVLPVRTQDAWWPGSAEERAPGEHVIAAAPLGAVAFEVMAYGRRTRGGVPADEDAARVALPSLFACTFHLTGAVERLDGLDAHVQVTGLADDGGWLRVPLPAGARTAELPRLFPGRYEAVVRGTGLDGVETLGAATFEVAPGAPARVEIEVR